MPETRVVRLPERFDFDCHQNFTEQCEQLLEATDVRSVVLDFSQVQYIDSAALGLMVLLYRKVSPSGIALSVRDAKGTAKDILNIANIQKFYTFE